MRGDILACYGETFLDKLISIVVGNKITHTALDFGGKIIAETRWNGVTLTDLDLRCGKYIVLRYPNLTESQLIGVTDYIRYNLGRPYDYVQMTLILVYVLFRIKLFEDSKSRVICVELVWNAFNSVGIDIAPHIEDKTFLVPSDLLTSPVLCVIREGGIEDV